MLGVLAARNLGFGLALAEICQTFVRRQCHRDMAISVIFWYGGSISVCAYPVYRIKNRICN
jgi:hypothetical protein